MKKIVLHDHDNIAAASFFFFMHLLAPKAGSSSRHATWLELFYDLIFVVAVAEVSRRAAQDLTIPDLLKSAFLFFTVAWAWMGHTFYSTRFDTDDFAHRALTILQMLGALGMALSIHGALEDLSLVFAVSYFSVRFILLLLYVHTRLHGTDAKSVVRLYLTGFGLGSAVWAVSLFVPAPLRFVLWGISLAIDFATPWLGIRILSKNPVHTQHVPERFGLFTIVLLGEHILASAHALEGTEWLPTTLVTAVIAFFLAAAIWWIYFLYLQEWEENQCIRGGQPFAFLHLLLWLGILGSVMGIDHALHAEHEVEELARWLLFGGTALFIYSLTSIDLMLRGRIRHNRLLSIATASTALLLGFVSFHFSPLLCLLSLLILLLAHIAIEERRIHGHAVWKHH